MPPAPTPPTPPAPTTAALDGPPPGPASRPAFVPRQRDAGTEAARAATGDGRAQAVLAALLAAHVPLSLLLDLADPYGPHSAELLWREPGSADWLPG